MKSYFVSTHKREDAVEPVPRHVTNEQLASVDRSLPKHTPKLNY